MTTPKATFAGLALIAALCAGFTLGLRAPAWAALAYNVHPPHEQQIQDTRKKDHWGANEWTALFSGGLFLVAFSALIFARNQIKIARRQTQVGVLFELEARWGSREILDGRAELNSLYNKVSKRIISKFPNDTEEERQKKLFAGFQFISLSSRSMT